MADQHNSNIPAIANQIANDIPDIKENLEYHKDVFEAFVNSWSDTTATNIKPKIIGDADNDTLIQAEEGADEDKIRFDCGGTEVAVFEDTLFTFNSVPKYFEKDSPSAAASTQFTSLNTGGLYKVSYRLSTSAESALKLTFNAVSTTSYHFLQEILVDASTAQRAGSATNAMRLVYTARTYHVGQFVFGTVGDTENVQVRFDGTHYTDSSNAEAVTGGGFIDLGEALTSVTLLSDPGTMTGTVVLERLS